MFCPKCATPNGDDAKFCRSCGTDISLVPQAVSGHLAERLAADEETRRGGRLRHRGDRGTPTIERAVKGLFMGVALIFIAFAVKNWMPGSTHWWFWLLLPAAGMLATGVSAFARLGEEKRRRAPVEYQPAQAAVPPPRHASALAPRETGEIITPPPSVTEGTTRHLGVPVERPRKDV